MFEGRRHVFVRLYRGCIEPGQEIRIGGRAKAERVARLFEVDAGNKRKIEFASAGQIVLLARTFQGPSWRSLSIPRGGSAAYAAHPTRERSPDGR
jgi:translation elongation factor EF-G